MDGSPVNRVYRLRNASWAITSPAEEFSVFNRSDDPYADVLPAPPKMLDRPLDIQPGDRVQLVRYGDDCLTAPVLEGPKTLRTLILSIEAGMTKPLTPADAAKVYYRTEAFGERPAIRMNKKFRRVELTAAELVGDHQFFEGDLQRVDGVWRYYTGS